ncbi:MAG: CBS domain-containing protein [Nitrospira sp.]|nr:CBS domain-containing protein [Nitrospira sp.]MBP6607703.1 CBS domain-containing protein [Nitrospira sp.]HQY57372.1 CBS domain-containing protein [Nitrospira sp.]HRA98239.1 CBS domain-containing protein [Nitrospira sp.]
MAGLGGSVQRPLAMMMRPITRTVHPDDTLLAVARQLRDARVGAMLVADHGDYVGIVSEADLVRKGMASGAAAEQVRARSVMSTPLMTIDIAQSAHEASDVMAERGIRHLVITEEGRAVGMISVRDLLRYFKNWGAM